MDGEGESLGKAVLDLEANLSEFLRNLRAGEQAGQRMQGKLSDLAETAELTERALNNVRMQAGQGAESEAVARRIESSTGRVGRAAIEAADHLERVKLDASNAAESDAAGDVIDRKLKQINRDANETRRALDRVRITSGRSGVGVGAIGSGYGRVGLLGTAIGAGTLAAPAAAPAAAGLLAGIPAFAAGAAGALGTVILAFQGVGKALKGDQDAFDQLAPSQQRFVQQIQSMSGWLKQLEKTAAGGLFDGLSKGLQAALSPGTLSAVSTAVQQFGVALGNAGETWGKYFGSGQFQQIFGPLMAAGARNLGVLSNAALSLFDALGVLGRAAIPLVNWLSDAAAKGAQLADTWLRAQDASGGLSSAMTEAQNSLRLVGHLVGALGNAVVALAVALYPVSKIFVKDLTDGLNALARIIDRNRDGIRDFAQGALAAVVSTVKTATPIVAELAHDLNAVVHAIGGWKVAFEIVIAGVLAAKFVSLGKSIYGIVGTIRKVLTAIGLLPAAATTAAAETDVALATIGTTAGTTAGEVGGLRAALMSLGAPAVLSTLGAAAAAVAAVLASSGDAPNVPKLPSKGTRSKLVKLAQSGKIPESELAAAAKAAGLSPDTPAGRAFDDPKFIAALTQYAQAHGLIAVPKPKPGQNPYGTPVDHRLRRGQVGKSGPILNFSVPGYALTEAQQLALALAKDPNSRAAITAKIAYDDRAESFAEQRIKAGKGSDSLVQQLQAIYADEAALRNQLAVIVKKHKPKPPPVIPPLAARAESLASSNASKAQAAGGIGATAEHFLKLELGDLSVALKALTSKYESSTGKVRTQLFAAITKVKNESRTVQQQLAAALQKDREDRLGLAIDTAREEVASAKEGSSAYAKATTALEHALKAEIAYLDKRAHNRKLSIETRRSALQQETADLGELHGLQQPGATGSGAASEQQFLSDFQNIVQSYAPNSFPAPKTSRADTHLYEAVHELRQQTRHLGTLIAQRAFPASAFEIDSTEAVFA